MKRWLLAGMTALVMAAHTSDAVAGPIGAPAGEATVDAALAKALMSRPLALPPLPGLAPPQTDGPTGLSDKISETTPEPQPLAIETRRHSLVRSDTVLLGDVATITGGSPETRRQVAQVELTATPPIGRFARLSAPMIEAALARMGLEEEKVAVSAPADATVARETQTLTQRDLERVVADAVHDTLSYPAQDVVIRDWNLPQQVSIPAGRLTLEVDFLRGDRAVATRSFEVTAWVDGDVARRVRGAVFVDVMVEAVRAIAPLERGRIINMANLETRREPLTTLPPQAVTDLTELEGMICVRPVRIGDVLRKDMVQAPVLVQHNETILMALVTPGMTLQTKGVSRGRGALGDVIPVINASSGKEVLARVVGPQRVQVLY